MLEHAIENVTKYVCNNFEVVTCILVGLVLLWKHTVIVAKAHSLHDDGDDDYGKTFNNIFRRLCMLSVGCLRLWAAYGWLSIWNTSLFASSSMPGLQYALNIIITLIVAVWAKLAYHDFRGACLLRMRAKCLCSRQAVLLPTVNPTEADHEKLNASVLEKAPSLTPEGPAGQ